jgi:serine/threonine protein kinase
MIEAASIFHNKGEKVGDIRPENIFINDNGQTKIACQYSWPH